MPNNGMLNINSPVDFIFDPYSEQAMTDPTALYRELRERYPAYPLPQYDAWVLSRFEDVWAVGEDGERFVMDIGPIFEPEQLKEHNRGVAPTPAPFNRQSFSQLDPPIQSALRQGVGGPLRPRSVERMEDTIRRLARERLDELVPRGEFDLYSEYGGIVSAGVMCTIVGLPTDKAPHLLELINGALRRNPPGISPGMIGPYMELHELLVEAVIHRRTHSDGQPIPAIDGLLRTEIDGVPLTDDQVAEQLGTILTGGTETVPKVVARCLLELSLRPEQLAEVRADLSANCRLAYEETMRFGAPLQHVGRTATQDVEIAGAHIKAGQRVFLMIPSANRDELEFDQPDEFIWNRKIERHFAFGHGLHFCIGAHVARLEGRILLEELLARIPDFTLDMSRALIPPSDFQIGYIKLPLVIT